jgi:hypothetical protein
VTATSAVQSRFLRRRISIEWVDYVDQKVHLNKPSRKAMSEWQIAAY